MANIFITGATGFIGQHLIKRLLEEGHDLYCLIRSDSPIIEKCVQIHRIYGDLHDCTQYVPSLKRAEYVIHLAGIINARRQEDFFRINIEGTRNLLNACRENCCHLQRFLFISSIAAVGAKADDSLLSESDHPEPETVYGKSKLQAEEEALKFAAELPVIILRPTFIYGPGDIRGLRFLKLLSEQDQLISFSIIETACLCYISDLVSACLLALKKPVSSGEIFHISDPLVYSWKRVNSILRQVVSELYHDASQDNLIFKRIFIENSGNQGKIRPTQLQRKYWGCSIEKAVKILGFKPEYTLLDGARETIRWYRDHNLYDSDSKYEPDNIEERIKKCIQ